MMQPGTVEIRPKRSPTQIHATCVARAGAGVLLLGPPGSGKSDLALRLIDRGFCLVADDRVDMADGFAAAPAALVGLLEVRGFGIMRMAHTKRAEVILAVALAPPGMASSGIRLPAPARHPELDLPLVTIDPAQISAACRVGLALDCVLGHASQVSGAFAP